MPSEKKLTKAARARAVMRRYPNLPAAKVAKRAGVDIQTVYQAKRLKPDPKRSPDIERLVRIVNGAIQQEAELKQVLNEIAGARKLP